MSDVRPKFRFSVTITVRFGDMDAMGHVNNARYLTYFEEARLAYYRSLFHLDLENIRSLSLILAEASVRFKRPARATDRLEVFVRTAEFGRKSFAMEYEILNADTRKLVAEGKTVQVMYDYEKNASIAVPEDMKEKILRFEESGAIA